MSLRASASQRAKQSPLKRVILVDKSQPLNRRLLRQRAAHNDIALRAKQAETEKELRRRRTLMPSVPVLSLSKGWIERLRESCDG
jgi:hypothetical protein